MERLVGYAQNNFTTIRDDVIAARKPYWEQFSIPQIPHWWNSI